MRSQEQSLHACKYTGSQNLGTKTVFEPYWHWLDPLEHYKYDFSSVQSSAICDKPQQLDHWWL